MEDGTTEISLRGWLHVRNAVSNCFGRNDDQSNPHKTINVIRMTMNRIVINFHKSIPKSLGISKCFRIDFFLEACTVNLFPRAVLSFRKVTSDRSILVKIKTDACAGTEYAVNYLEHVQAVISVNATRRGDLELFLTSPMGTRYHIFYLNFIRIK